MILFQQIGFDQGSKGVAVELLEKKFIQGSAKYIYFRQALTCQLYVQR